jgi:hypothetical protein
MILKHLIEKFSPNLWTNPEVFLYLKDHGVDYNIFENLIQLKYNLITVDWKHEFVKYCRGTIIDMTSNTYKANPFIKFFNRTELNCQFKDVDVKNFDNGKLYKKCDGTCIILYYNNGWKVSTLGSINNTSTLDNGKTYSQMFFELSDIDYDSLNMEHTYIFELCCDVNQIVTKYDSDRIYYLGTNDEAKATVILKELQEVFQYDYYIKNLLFNLKF